ncbi:aminotransferase class IV [Aestuariispira insulae]|uniref:Probable branched-chain-amino-acid aminotransferase n=1 Tax=Aestuariispira insulae TaxID=1461337 RepID=A0A3D9HJK1_9PROT|nr:aminotransferase class IV [Aestuariispira insulae]RED49692.1 branched-chain amino acid aminotransferase [Aestuariispira insulae]
MKSWLNGAIIDADAAKIAPNDRGFLLADGLFETLKAAEGKILHCREHLQRLRRSLTVLKLDIAQDDDMLESTMYLLLAENGLEHASLRLTVTRGTGPRGLLPPETNVPTILITCSPSGREPTELPPARLMVSEFRRNEGSPLSRLKVLNYLDNILALQSAKADGFDDAVLLNNAGHVACVAAANIFLKRADGTWITPPISDGVLPGITRRSVLDLAVQNGLNIEEASLSSDGLDQVQAGFLTNSLINIRPIAAINGRVLSGELPVFLSDGRVV